MKKKICAAVIAVLIVFTVWQGVSVAKKLGRLSELKQLASERAESLNSPDILQLSKWPIIIFAGEFDAEGFFDVLINTPQRHDITAKEMKSVQPNTPVEEFVSRFGGVHGSTGSGIIYYYYFLEDGKHAVFETGPVESEDGVSREVVTYMYIFDDIEPSKTQLLFY